MAKTEFRFLVNGTEIVIHSISDNRHFLKTLNTV